MMYQKCKLVHADLSEYNILYNKGSPVIIDVSQSVEHYHPKALEFLRNDVNSITTFFNKRGVDCLSPRSLFDFITDSQLEDEKMDSYLDGAMKKVQEKEGVQQTYEEQMQDGMFQAAYIPRKLGQVSFPEKEIFDNAPAFHQAVTGLVPIAKQDSEEEVSQ